MWVNNGRFGEDSVQVVDPTINPRVYRAALLAGLRHLRDHPDSGTADTLVHDFVGYVDGYHDHELGTLTDPHASACRYLARTQTFNPPWRRRMRFVSYSSY